MNRTSLESSPLARLAAIALVLIAFVGTSCGGSSSTTWSAAPSAKCLVSFPSATISLQSSGGASTAPISAPQECAWTASSMVSWITGVSPATGQGTAQLAFSVAPNPITSVRQGDIDVNGQRLTVRQAAAPCNYAISPTNLTIGADAFSGNVTVSATSTCAWTAVSESGWIAITSGSAGTGDGRVGFSVSPNSGETRTGTVTIAGQTFSLSQSAVSKSNCTYTIQPATYSTDANGGSGALAVKASSGCAWTVSSTSFWIDVTGGMQGAGDGTIAFVVASNPGTSARTGTIVVADRTFTVEQSGAAICVYGLSSTSQQAAAAGGVGTPIAVATTAGCPWTAASSATWLTIAAGATGDGNGVVNFTVAANPGAARTGGLIVAGQAVTVTQAGASVCVYSISPGSQSAGTAGGAGTPIAVSANGGCAWTATSNDSWLTITSGASGTGNGTVNFTIAANAGAQRTGSLAIAGQTFTVTQAVACVYSISPDNQSIGAPGGSGTPIAVTASAGCAWTSTSNANWLTILTGASGTGIGPVTFTIAANAGAGRTGSLTVAGQTFTVTQAGLCAYVIAPSSQSAGAAGGAGTPVAVTAAPSCSWTATSNAAWLTVTSGAIGSGTGAVGFTIAANPGAARTGTLSIAGQTFTVSQAAGCGYSISPNSQSVGNVGGAGTPIAVSAGVGCGWTATSGAAWLTILTGASGAGNGIVTFTIAPNLGAPRTGTLAVAGQTFTVIQADGCSYTIKPANDSVGKDGGKGTPIDVRAVAGCTWTAASNVGWITITSGASGNGDGTVGFNVDSNPGAARTGTLTVAGKVFTVTQEKR